VEKDEQASASLIGSARLDDADRKPTADGLALDLQLGDMRTASIDVFADDTRQDDPDRDCGGNERADRNKAAAPDRPPASRPVAGRHRR
jgi:hypothetical protein